MTDWEQRAEYENSMYLEACEKIKKLEERLKAADAMEHWFDFFYHEHDFKCVKYRQPNEQCDCGLQKFGKALQAYRQLSEGK